MRVKYRRVLPAAVDALKELEHVVSQSGLELQLLELVRMRASQLNGCAYCLNMHGRNARAHGVDQQRLDVLAGWRDAPLYTARERAALAWCEASTLLPERGAPDAVYDELAVQFDKQELTALTFAIVAINSWNRLAAGFRSPIDDHVAPSTRAQTHTGSSVGGRG